MLDQNELSQKTEQVRELLGSEPKYAYVRSFGCQLNFAEGEKFMALLQDMGYILTEEEAKADFILLNTCAVREHAEDRVFGIIGSMKQYKQKNPSLILAIAGCMTAEEQTVEKLKKSYPFVNFVIGTAAMDQLPDFIIAHMRGKKRSIDVRSDGPVTEAFKQLRGNTFKASVPIMYGCNNFCSYCIVPYVRGRERSREPEHIIAEVKSLLEQGYKEILLLGQNVNSYGKGNQREMNFSGLLRELDSFEGEYMIRFMSSHPKDADTELIDTILNSKHIEPHLHLAVQCGNNELLKQMNRHYTVEKYLEIVNYARERNPEFSFSTDIIVGFPNETEEQFQGTLELLKKVRYDNIYSFIYSKREGTKAALIEDHISYETKTERMSRLLALQREITDESYRRFLGKTQRILIEKRDENGMLLGKNKEGIIVLTEGADSLISQFVTVEITETRNWAVVGKIV